MTAEGCRDHATTIEECMGCNGGRWDPEAADQLIEAGYAVGITAAAIRVARAEIDRYRAMVQRLEAWAVLLESDTFAAGGIGVGPFIAAELRNRMNGDGG